MVINRIMVLTFAPSLAKRRTIALPIEPPPPVTSATLLNILFGNSENEAIELEEVISKKKIRPKFAID